MDSKFNHFLKEWKKPFLRDRDLISVFKNEDTRRYDSIKYALRKGMLTHVKRGIYLTGNCEPFEIAQVIYGPSYISLESALSYHGWIPEAVYVCTSVCVKRSNTVLSPTGAFRYSHTPAHHFYMNVRRVEEDKVTFLMAEPWKAIADMIYCSKKNWKSIEDLNLDLRIEVETLKESDLESLSHIAKHYDSPRVRHLLSHFLEELS